MKRLFSFFMVFMISLVTLVAEGGNLSFITTTFGRAAEAKAIDGKLRWFFPAEGLSLAGEGTIDWKGVSVADISALERITLPDGTNGVGVAGMGGANAGILYFLKDVWGGLELADTVPAFVAEEGERIGSFACYRDEKADSYILVVATDRRLVARTRSGFGEITDSCAIAANTGSALAIRPDARPFSTDLLVFSAAQSTSGCVASLWSLSEGRLASLGSQSPVACDIGAGSWLFAQSGTDRSALMLSGKRAIQWSWSGNVPAGSAVIPLAGEPDAFVWHGAGEKAIFLSASEEKLFGAVTSSSGISPAIAWSVSIPGTIGFTGNIMQKGDGFRLWCVASDSDATTAYSVEISASGKAAAVSYGAIKGNASGVTVALRDGAWILSAGTGRAWKLDETEQKLVPLQIERNPFSMSEGEGM